MLAIAASATMGAAAGAAAGPADDRGAPALLAEAAAARSFAIRAQGLPAALEEFGRQSGLQLSYPSDVVAGASSPGVAGSFTPEQALRQILSGTGVVYRFTDGGTVTLEKVAAQSGTLTLNPVTVTGERTLRSLMDTASSVSVYDEQTLEARPRIDSTRDVLERAPNVTTTDGTNFAPAVRGVDGTGPAQGADAFFAGVRPRLNIQIDGRPASYNEVVFGDFGLWDARQVEVFRGPQSTLQGRNAIAGAIVVRTNDPTYTPEARARVIVGNQDTQQYSGVVSGPIIEDQLAARIAFDRKTYSSFVNFESFPEVDDPGDFEALTIRGKLLIEPKAFEDFSTLITVNHSEFTGPQGEQVTPPYDEHNAAFPQMPVFKPKTTSAIAESTYRLNENFTIENTFSYTDLFVKRIALAGTGNVKIDGTEILGEPRLRFTGMDGRLNGFGGVHIFRAYQDEMIDFGGNNIYEDRTWTTAVFGEATLGVTEDVDITLGGRFEREHRKRNGGEAPFFDVDLDKIYNVFLPKAGVAWHATEELTVGATVARGYNGGGAGVSFAAPFVAYTYDPEYVWTYEIYGRADLLEGKLQLTGNAFYSDYKDFQLPFHLSALSTVIRNADRVRTYGAEFGAKWLAAPGLEVFGDVGVLKTEIVDFPGSGVDGNALARSPNVTADFGAIYRHDSGVEFGADARVTDSYYSDVDNNPRGKTDPYVVVNTQLGYTFGSGARIFAFCNNLFDTGEPTMIFPDEGDTANIVRPRTFGIGFQMTF